MIAAEQNSYNYALGGDNLWLACVKLVGIAGLLPSKYGVKVPAVPDKALLTVKQYSEQKELKKWIEDTQKVIYEGIQKFIEEEYKKGSLDF